jgi:non-specific serine/threonine protein kinase
MAACLNGLGNIARDRADYRHARSLYEESLAIYRELDDLWAVALVLNNLGETAQYARDVSRAQSLYTEGLAIARVRGDRWQMANSVQGLADVAQQRGDHVTAQQLYEQSLAINMEINDRGGIAARLEGFAGLAAAHNEPARALRLAGAAARLRASTAAPRRPPEDEFFRLWLRPTESALREGAAKAAWDEGQTMSDEQAVAYALERTSDNASPLAPETSRLRGQQQSVLTRREHEVAALVAGGLTNREIAKTLVITLSTAERHVANILSKLALRSRTEVALWAVERGLDARACIGGPARSSQAALHLKSRVVSSAAPTPSALQEPAGRLAGLKELS